MIKEIIEEILAVEHEAKEKLMACVEQSYIDIANAQDEAKLIIEKAKADAITKATDIIEDGAKRAESCFCQIVDNAKTAKVLTDEKVAKAVALVTEYIKEHYGDC